MNLSLTVRLLMQSSTATSRGRVFGKNSHNRGMSHHAPVHNILKRQELFFATQTIFNYQIWLPAVVSSSPKGNFSWRVFIFIRWRTSSRIKQRNIQTQFQKKSRGAVQSVNKIRIKSFVSHKPKCIHSGACESMFKRIKCSILCKKKRSYSIWWQQRVSKQLGRGHVYHCVASFSNSL